MPNGGWAPSAESYSTAPSSGTGANSHALLQDYVDHYNRHRPHRSLHNAPPEAPEAPEVAVFDPDRAIQKRAVCGGLINEYRQAA